MIEPISVYETDREDLGKIQGRHEKESSGDFQKQNFNYAMHKYLKGQ
jgi:hypothetical protein